MSDELKPCPFCGCDASMQRFNASTTPARIICKCGIELRAVKGQSVESIVEQWNTRVAVTDEQFAAAVHDGRLWQVVRECHDAGTSDNFFRCSNCGCEIMRCVDGWRPLYMGEVNFCPNCGSKVVAE